MRDFGWFENAFWDASWHLFAGRPVLTYDIYIEFLLKNNNNNNNKNNRKPKQNKKKSSQKKFNVNTTVPRHAWWDFRGVLDDTLLLYLGFDMNKHFKNWGNHEVL